jgi:hypothetical protein
MSWAELLCNWQFVSQSVRPPWPRAPLWFLSRFQLKLDNYGVDDMGRLPWREDGSAFFTRPSTGVFIIWPSEALFARPSIGAVFTWPAGVSFARPPTGIFITWPYRSVVSMSVLCPLLLSVLLGSRLDDTLFLYQCARFYMPVCHEQKRRQ